MSTTVFYEVSVGSRVSHLSDLDETMFDAINNAGAITRVALFDRLRRQGYSAMDMARALGHLEGGHYIERRTLAEE